MREKLRKTKEYLLPAAFGLVVAIFIFYMAGSYVEFCSVSGPSMEPTFTDGDMVILDLASQDYEIGDIVVFYADESETEKYIKRVCGVPGDRIEMLGGILFRNDEEIKEDYVKNKESVSELDEITLGDGQYFLLGDNRPESMDSRSFGPVSKEVIRGRVCYPNK